MIIGLTGPNASGKSEVANHLGRRGFALHSLSDVVREEARASGLGVDRDALIVTGNRMRREGGAGVLARRILARLGPRCVVDSIRHPEEVRVLRERPDFRLVGVDAPVDVRFRRARARGRTGDPETLESFRATESRERGLAPEAQDLPGTFAMADHVLRNDGTLEQLRRDLDGLLEALRAEGVEV